MTENLCHEIQVQEQLTNHWPAWFDGLTLTQGEDNTTVLRGPVAG